MKARKSPKHDIKTISKPVFDAKTVSVFACDILQVLSHVSRNLGQISSSTYVMLSGLFAALVLSDFRKANAGMTVLSQGNGGGRRPGGS